MGEQPGIFEQRHLHPTCLPRNMKLLCQ
jgi:hypothetical protein